MGNHFFIRLHPRRVLVLLNFLVNIVTCKHFQLKILKIRVWFFQFLTNSINLEIIMEISSSFRSSIINNYLHIASGMSSKFCIVHFIEEESVEVVPDFWIFQVSGIDYCSWPPHNAFSTKCVKRRIVPDEKWPSYKCRILHSFGT